MSWYARKILFVIVGLLIFESRRYSVLGDADSTEWWKTTLVYQIWPRSFQDSNGDGIGDIQGIINRLDYIEDLGVQTICLNPIYPSPLVDSGYDVSDYESVHPELGDLSDFDVLVNEAHERDIKVILDVVPNHTSDRHPWFNASIHMMDPHTDYYIWANGTVNEDGTIVPPNNRTSTWANEESSAWTYNDDRNQWYYHKFHESEPDLNLDNPDVRDEIMLILEFWLNRGVDGFRITGVPYFYEDSDSQNEPYPSDQINMSDEPKNVQFLYDIRTFVDDWTELNNSTSKYLITGSYDTNENLLSYYGNDEKIGIPPLNYCLITNVDVAGSNASELEIQIEDWLNAIPSNASTNWALSNRDNWRIASRAGTDRLDALHMLSMLLPGQAITYYGDEIGMLDTPLRANSIIDDSISDTRNKPDDHDDDHEYSVGTAMQWDDTTSAGFSTSALPYVPVNENYVDVNVAEQLDNPRSHLNVYKRLAKLRKNPVFVRGDWELETLNDDDVLVLRRTLTDHPVYVVVINLADAGRTVNMTELYPDLSEHLEVVVTSGTDDTERTTVPQSHFPLLSNAGLVLKSGQFDASKFIIPPVGNEEKEKEEEEAEEEYDGEEIEKIITTTDYIDTTSEKFVTATIDSQDNSEKTIDHTTNEHSEKIIPKTVDSSSSGSNVPNENSILAISIIFGNLIIAGSWLIDDLFCKRKTK